MAKFAYNNIKNDSISHTLFEFNSNYHPQTFYKKDVNPYFQSKSADKLIKKLRKLMTISKKNLYHIQKLQKHYYDKYTKFKSYASDEKIWFNSKYVKTKQNCKLEQNSFRTFKVLYLIGKYNYKLKLLKRYKIYGVFYILL